MHDRHGLEQVSKLKVVPIISIDDADAASPLGDALLAGGLPLVEITFRTDAAEAAIRALARRGDLLVGAGTVLTPAQAERAVAAGARFVVSPGFEEEVVAKCRELGVPVVPGIATPPS